jgi:hypothetical protein
MMNIRFYMLAAALAFPVPASAHIACDGSFQILPSGPVSTPFCQDEALAKKARGQGSIVTGDAVRQHPAIKADLCAGSQDFPACTNYGND